MKRMQLFQRIRPAIESKAMELQRYEEWSTITTLELWNHFVEDIWEAQPVDTWPIHRIVHDVLTYVPPGERTLKEPEDAHEHRTTERALTEKRAVDEAEDVERAERVEPLPELIDHSTSHLND